MRCRYRRSLLVGFSLVLTAAVASVASPAEALPDRLSAVQLEKLVLQDRDVGAAYSKNRSFSRPRTFSEASNGDSPKVTDLLRRLWKGGYQTGFNGRTVPWGVSSTADLFANAKLDSIVSAWKADILRLSNGRLISVPPTAPGTRRFLVAGRIRYPGRTINTMIYMWQEGPVLGSVTIAGDRPRLPLSTLLSFARIQDRKIRETLASPR
jgi:hypothetical protein